MNVKFITLRNVYGVLLAFSLCVVMYAAPALAQTEYQLIATFQSPELTITGEFGWSVAVSGDLVVVGETSATVEGLTEAGRAYLFDTKGTLITTLQAPEPEAWAWFGQTVAVSGDLVVVGEIRADVEGTEDAGRAYIFDAAGNILATLRSPTPQVRANFGGSVVVSGDLVVVSEINADVEGTEDAGRVYLFDTAGNLLATLQAPEPEANTYFGRPVVVSGDLVVVGEIQADVEGVNNAGRIHLFDTAGTPLTTLQAPTPMVGAEFGNSVAVDGDLVVVGAHYTDVEGKIRAGQAYLFGSTETSTVTEFPYDSILLGLAGGIIICQVRTWRKKRRS